MADIEPQWEKWIFGGSRIGKNNTRIHEWIDADGKEMLFKAQGSPVVGSIYRFKVIRDGKRISRVGKAEYTGERADDDVIAPLAAQHKAAEITLQVKARERADKRDDPMEALVNELAGLAAHIPPSQRVAFAAYVTQRLTRAWMDKPK